MTKKKSTPPKKSTGSTQAKPDVEGDLSADEVAHTLAHAVLDSHDRVEVDGDGKGGAKIKPQDIGQVDPESDKVLPLNDKFRGDEIIPKERPEKRIYRKAGSDELFDPEQPPTSEANKLSVKFGARMSREHRSMFNAAAKSFPSQRAAIERAVELLAAEVSTDDHEPT